MLEASGTAVEEGGGDGEGEAGDGGGANEPHYERAPISQGGAGLVSDGKYTSDEG